MNNLKRSAKARNCGEPSDTRTAVIIAAKSCLDAGKNLTDLEISVVKSQIFNQSHELQKTKPKKFTQAWNCAIAKLLDYPKQPFSIDQEKVADACFKLIQG